MKRITVTIAAMAFATMSQAQIQQSENRLVTESVGGSLLVVEQTYKVKDRNAELYYGLDGRNEFGKSLSIAVRLNGGLCYTSQFVAPWLTDPNYQRYKAGYLPIYAGAQFKYVADSALRGFPFDSTGCKKTESDMVYLTAKTPFDAQGLEPDTVAGNKQGWLLWVVSNDTVNRTDSLIIEARSCNITVSDTMLFHKANQPKYQVVISSKPYTNVLGGVFVTPQFSAIGNVKFMLTGIIVKKDNEWKLVTPFVRQVRQPAASMGELTPITPEQPANNQSNKNRKTR